MSAAEPQQPSLTVLAHEVKASVLAGAQPAGEGLAEAVSEFLRERQNWLAQRVSITPGKDCAIVTCRSRSRRKGERPMDLLRAVQGALGMADKLPEVADSHELAEIDVDPARFCVAAEPSEEETFGGEEILSSRVRYFPLPTCEWYEICDGRLTLQPDRLVFEPTAPILPDRSVDARGRLVMPLNRVGQVRRDTWWRLPCLTISLGDRAYRYGWPAFRTDPASEFELDEWLEALQRLMGR